jgi:hypothetical protein
VVLDWLRRDGFTCPICHGDFFYDRIGKELIEWKKEDYND